MGHLSDWVPARLAAFEQQLAGHVQWIVDSAAAAPPGGSFSWDRVLHHYGAAPDPPLSRLEELRSRQQTRGATITEVRRAVAAMTERAAAELEQIASGIAGAAAGTDDGGALHYRFSSLRAHLSRLVDEAAAGYAARVCSAQSAATAGVAGIFANARETARKAPWAGQKIDPARVLACHVCGAPQEVELDFNCRYCRSPMLKPPGPTGGEGGSDE